MAVLGRGGLIAACWLLPAVLGIDISAYHESSFETGTLSLKSVTPEPVRLDPERVPTRTGRRLLDHTEMHNIQILQGD